MPRLARLRDLDARAWSTATWAAPFTVEFVIGVMVVVLWALSKLEFFSLLDRSWVLTGVVLTALVSVLTSGLLLTSPSSRVRGLGLSGAGSAAVVLVGGAIIALLLH